MKTKNSRKKNVFEEFDPKKVLIAPKTFEMIDKFGRYYWKTENYC